MKQLEHCISLGADVDERDGNGSVPLMWAADRGHQAAVQFLIARKANVNQTNTYGCFPLFYAAHEGHKDICQLLLKAGADKHMKFRSKTAAQWAAEKGHKELAALIEC